MTAISATKHVTHNAARCAHAAIGRQGCSRCVECCPEGAVISTGSAISLKPAACLGCGSCVATCPTGAMALIEGGEAIHLALAEAAPVIAGQERPMVLFHDLGHGRELLDAVREHAGGVPESVVAVGVPRLGAVGAWAMLAALTLGASQVGILFGRPSRGLRTGLEQSVEAAATLVARLGLGEGRFDLHEEDDPWVLADRLAAIAPAPALAPSAGIALEVGNARSMLHAVADDLWARVAEPPPAIDLPSSAGCGTILVDAARCTLCQGCARVCPAGALLVSSAPPRLGIVERTCVQCGLCKATCPEGAITLQPRLAFGPAASEPRVLKEDEMFACVSCGTPFAPRSSVERMIAMLGNHPMFAAPGGLDRLKSCEQCRGNS